MNKPGQGRKPEPWGKTKAVQVPVGCMAQVYLIIRQFKDAMKRKPDETVI